jgi:predicted methyltransferase
MRVLALALAILLAGPASAAPDHIANALADASRPAADRALDGLRKPGEVLAFAGVKPGQRIGEYLPGGGYYTRLLSGAVGPSGKVYALETTTWSQENIEATRKAAAGRPNVALDLTPLGQFKLPEKVDLFWTTLNYHDLHVPKYAEVDMAKFNKQVFDSLKPGGTYLIVDHAARAGSGAADAPTLHRIEKATLIREVTAAGFKLDGESRVLANPADDHTKVVFDPAIRGKTDQFVLKFRRP